MKSARRLVSLEPEKCEHTGLALATLLENHGKIPSARGSTEGTYESKHFKEVADARVPEVYAQAFRRWKENFDPEKVKAGEALVISVTTSGPLAIGLGNESPLEVGLSVHHTYGVPYLPGSAIKGLMTRAADQYGIGTEHKEILFGSMKSAAHIVYWDGWLEPSSTQPFQHDVITVHHPEYYSSKGKDKNGKDIYPTDFDDPNPVSFLSVKPGSRFCIVLSSESEGALEWLNMAGEILKYALEEMGLGAKTNSGYGYFKDVKFAKLEKPKSQEEIDVESAKEFAKKFERQISGINGRNAQSEANKLLDIFEKEQAPVRDEALRVLIKQLEKYQMQKEKFYKRAKILLEGDV